MQLKIVFIIIGVFYLLLAPLTGQARQAALAPRDSLDNILEYPIMIDGGCSFFGYAGKPLTKANYVMVISVKKTAFIQYHKQFIYFNFLKRLKTPEGYTDYFKGLAGRMVLRINNIKQADKYTSLQWGTLSIQTKKFNQTISVAGSVESLF